MRKPFFVLLGVGCLLLFTGAALGQHSSSRAGHPEEVSKWAKPSDTGRYVGYYVGGGTAVGGHYRGADEGTWGWDYCGLLVPRRIVLRWSHGRYQGGTGAYKTDGPHFIERIKEKKEE